MKKRLSRIELSRRTSESALLIRVKVPRKAVSRPPIYEHHVINS
jgi:hypothetical protein